MNLLKRWFGKTNKEDRTKTKPPSHDYWYYHFGYADKTQAGVEINEYTALNYSAVFNAIYLISSTIGSLPLNLYQAKNKSKKLLNDLSVFDVLHNVANPEMTAMTLRETMTAHMLAWGNCYAEIVRNSYGEIIELWPISPNRVKIERFNGQLYYTVSINSEDITFTRDKILHIPGLGFDGIQGYSVVQMAREDIGLLAATRDFGARYFGAGTNPGVILSHPGKLSQEAHGNLKKSMVSAYSGLGKSHKLMLLEEGMKLEKIGIPPNDSQFLETRQFQVPEIARWFNLPPHKLKDLTKSSFSNIEQEQMSFIIDSILPWLVRFEQNYNMQLLTNVERKNGQYFKHIVEGLLRGDSESRGKFYNQMFQIGAYSINDIRELEDKNPIENGDEHFVPLNMAPVSQVVGGIPIEPTKPTKQIEQIEQEPWKVQKKEETVDEIKSYFRQDFKQIKQIKQIEQLEQNKNDKNNIVENFKPLFEDIIARFVRREIKAIEKNLKIIEKDSPQEFYKWLDIFYSDLENDLIRDITPFFTSYFNILNKKVDLTKFSSDFAKRFINDSKFDIKFVDKNTRNILEKWKKTKVNEISNIELKMT